VKIALVFVGNHVGHTAHDCVVERPGVLVGAISAASKPRHFWYRTTGAQKDDMYNVYNYKKQLQTMRMYSAHVEVATSFGRGTYLTK
jgi:hypothetical protein